MGLDVPPAREKSPIVVARQFLLKLVRGVASFFLRLQSSLCLDVGIDFGAMGVVKV